MSNIEFITDMEKTLKHILKEHPENEPMIKVFGPILLCEEKLLSEHALTKKPTQNKGSGSPLLDIASITISPEKAGIFSRALLSTIEQALPHLRSEIKLIKECLKSTAASKLCKDFLSNKKERQNIINNYIDNNLLSCAKKNMSTRSDTTTTKTHIADIQKKKEAFYSILELLLTRLSHVFLARATRTLPKANSNTNKSTCPYCGNLPSMSIVHEKEGQRDLLCSSCGGTWRFKRTSCPNCLFEEQKNLHLTYQEPNQKERAIHCASCNHYLLEVDIREREIPTQCITALSLGMSHLDAIMHKNGAIPFSEKL